MKNGIKIIFDSYDGGFRITPDQRSTKVGTFNITHYADIQIGKVS